MGFLGTPSGYALLPTDPSQTRPSPPPSDGSTSPPLYDCPFDIELEKHAFPRAHASSAANIGSSRPLRYRLRSSRTILAVSTTSFAIALTATITLFALFPFPTTIHVFIGAALGITVWTLATAVRVLLIVVLSAHRRIVDSSAAPNMDLLRSFSPLRLVVVVAGLCLVGFWYTLGIVPQPEMAPVLPAGEKYFIAANLYNSGDIMGQWSEELIKLTRRLGPHNTFVSIYESNSDDDTPKRLVSLMSSLDKLGVGHRIVSDKSDRWWPYPQAPERVAFLANVRNKVLEPLQSPNTSIRLPDYNEYTKVLFLNDVVFTWEAAVRLLATDLGDGQGSNYDLACGMDYVQVGLYDLWVARDVCGSPMRIIWPHVQDEVSRKRLREFQPIEVSSCWNGIVAFKTDPILYRPPSQYQHGHHSYSKRGWKMIDNTVPATFGKSWASNGQNRILDPTYEHLAWEMHFHEVLLIGTYPNSLSSPELTMPLHFRTSEISACDHSECFLFSYDLHRLYDDRRPRIVMNPNVQVAYKRRWWVWQNVVLESPVIRWWRYHWSHGIPLRTVDWLWDFFLKKRDYCTWSALAKHAPERCPPLPGSIKRDWSE